MCRPWPSELDGPRKTSLVRFGPISFPLMGEIIPGKPMYKGFEF